VMRLCWNHRGFQRTTSICHFFTYARKHNYHDGVCGGTELQFFNNSKEVSDS
jgi:hypothetical protein